MGYRRTRTAQHIQGIDAPRSHGGHVVGLGGTLATLIFALGIGFNTANVTENALGEAQTLPFFP
ncbi:hypothetical protein D3C77_720440 [compost metagenome]